MHFSIICPSIRPELWKEVCDSLSDNKIEWEILFIGPKEPVCELPSNVRHIKTNVKPSQATHIGFLEAKGEYVALTADDATYFSPNHRGALDNMYELIKKFPEDEMYNKDKIAYGFRMFENQFCSETSHTHYIIPDDINKPQDKRSPLLYPFFAIKKGVYEELGGYDNRFICGQAENDFLYRIYRAYGHTQSSLCPTAMVWALHDKHNNASGFRTYHSYECELVKKLWTIWGQEQGMKWVHQRLEADIHPYINDNTLLFKSQGVKGDNNEWD